MSVLVLDRSKQPLMPCTERRARLLLGRGRAVVVRAYPFTIRLKDRTGGITQPLRIKIDPGSKTTGIAVVRESGSFNIQTNSGAIQGISHRHCVLTQRADGYGYHIQPNQPKEKGDRENESR